MSAVPDNRWPAGSVARIATVLLAVVCFCSAAAGQQLVPRILNGIPTDDFPSVGIVGTRQLGGFCTGTLITPQHVLTAAHCAALATGPTDGTFQLDGVVYTTSQIFIHPDFNSRTLDNDIAIYRLSEPVEGVEPSPILRQPPQVGETLTIVGFGAGGDGQWGEDGTFGIKRAGTTTIEVVTDTLVIWEFDSESEANTGPGDSGGPGFLLVEGQYFIASITSAGTEPDAGLGDIAFNTRVDAYAEWIDEVVAAASGSDDQANGDQSDDRPDDSPGGQQPAKPCPGGHDRPQPPWHHAGAPHRQPARPGSLHRVPAAPQPRPPSRRPAHNSYWLLKPMPTVGSTTAGSHRRSPRR